MHLVSFYKTKYISYIFMAIVHFGFRQMYDLPLASPNFRLPERHLNYKSHILVFFSSVYYNQLIIIAHIIR